MAFRQGATAPGKPNATDYGGESRTIVRQEQCSRSRPSAGVRQQNVVSDGWVAGAGLSRRRKPRGFTRSSLQPRPHSPTLQPIVTAPAAEKSRPSPGTSKDHGSLIDDQLSVGWWIADSFSNRCYTRIASTAEWSRSSGPRRSVVPIAVSIVL